MRIGDFYPDLEAHLLSMPGVETNYQEEWDWRRFVVRGKQFAAFCCDGTDSALITVKCEPEFNDFVRTSFPDIIIPGYYCNKVHWNSIKPDGGVPKELVFEMCERGYRLILYSLSKKVQREILEDSEK